MLIPAGLTFTPLAPLGDPPILEPPMRCAGCGACLCPAAASSDDLKFWRCPFCNQMTPVVSMTGFAHARSNATAEYALEEVVEGRPLFVLVVDQSGSRARFGVLRDAVTAALALLPDDSDVGFITFCSTTRVHDLSVPGHTLTFAIDPLAARDGIEGEWMCVTKDVSDEIQAILARIDGTLPEISTGAKRCTGHALQTALALVSASKRTGAHILLFTGGPCTHGEGKIAEGIPRTWKDIRDGKKELSDEAAAFYEQLAVDAIDAQARVSVIAGAQMDVGLYEMRPLVQCTGGMALMDVRFDAPALRASLRELLTREWARAGRMVVQCTPNWTVEDALGPIARICPDGTWLLNAFDCSTTLALYLDVLPDAGDTAMMQIVLEYTRHDGRRMVRVTTVRAPLASTPPTADELDLGVALTLLSRRAVFKFRREPPIEVLRWVDKTLIAAWIAMGSPSAHTALLLAQGVYFFRRGRLMKEFGFSPDQTAYAHMHLMRETSAESARMHLPLLDLFDDSGTRTPLAPSSSALSVDGARLFDDYFHVRVVCSSGTPPSGPAAMAALDAARAIAKARFPVPDVLLCADGDSEARYLLAGVTPSTIAGHQPADVGILSDEVSFEYFLEYLNSTCAPAQ